MNQAELALYIELAPKLNEYRGEWQYGDSYFYKGKYYFVGDGTVWMYNCKIPSDAIWLPKAIDPLDPERIARGEKPRGLWGILTQYDEIGSCKLQQWAVGNHTVSINGRDFSAVTPAHVLLLALKAQWEEEK